MNRARVLAAALASFLLLSLFPPAVQAGGSTASLTSWGIKQIDIPVADMAYDASREVLLVSVGSRSASLGNELVEINPTTGAIGRHVFVGSSPRSIALTDDAGTAYVALRGANRIVRVDLGTFKVVSSFSLGRDPRYGPLFAGDLEAMPGRSDTVVAALETPRVHPSFQGLTVYRNGVALPGRYTGWTASRIEFVDANTMVGYDRDSIPHPLSRIRIDDSGLSHLTSKNAAHQGNPLEIEFAGGVVYTSDGATIDPATLDTADTFSIGSALDGAVEVTPDNGRATFLSQRKVVVFNRDSGQLIESRTADGLPAKPAGLAATGTGFAATGDGILFLLGPSVVSISPPVSMPPPPPMLSSGWKMKTLPFHSSDGAYDEAKDLLYVSVPAQSPAHGGSLLAIRPADGSIVKSLALGGDPGYLALSGDRSRLFVLDNDSDRVTQVDLLLFIGTESFTLGNPELRATDIEVQPGTNDTVAVVYNDLSLHRSYQVAMFKAGVRLPQTAEYPIGPDRLAFGSASALYGANTTSSTEHFFELLAGAAGPAPKTIAEGMLPGDSRPFQAADVKAAEGRVFSGDARVIDPGPVEQVANLDPTVNRLGTVEVVPSMRRVFYHVYGILEEYDLDTYKLLGSRVVPTGLTTRLVSTGSGLALSSLNGTILLGPEVNPDPVPPSHRRAAAFGWNGLGALGDGTTADHKTPATVTGVRVADEVAVGLHHSVAIEQSGSVWTWGFNATGALGDGTTIDKLRPVMIPYPTGIQSVAAGFLHTLALKNDGTVWAWGWNIFGQVGDGTTDDRVFPAQVPGLTDVVAISAGGFHSVAVKRDGSVWAWGWNILGQVGPNLGTELHSPVQVAGLSSVRNVSAGGFHNLALHDDFTVSSWGWNLIGQLGDGTTIDRPAPRKVPGLSQILYISAGYGHSLATGSNGHGYAWGWNALGQLGTGDLADRHAPVRLGGDRRFGEVSAGMLHSMAMPVNWRDEAWAWGWNGFGQLGDGTDVYRVSPVHVANSVGVIGVAAGAFHSMLNYDVLP